MQQVRFRDAEGYTRYGELCQSEIIVGEETYDVDDVELLAPVEPGKVVCVAKNYADGIDDPEEYPDRPILFLKTPNTVTGPGTTVVLPDDDDVFYEGELAVVIDRQCRNVSSEAAMDYVSGFTCANDLSNRADENMVRRKAFDNAAPLGPVIASPDEVPADARLEVRINGEVRQQSSRSELIFSVPEIIESISETITLEPGDVILTASPPGMSTLSRGDTIEIEIEGIGTLEHSVK